MPDREKVINLLHKAVEAAKDHDIGYAEQLCRDALPLLEPRVLTADEVVNLPEVAWLDIGDESRVIPVLPYAMEDIGYEQIVGFRCVEGCLENHRISRYGTDWRLWTEKPTEAKRKEVKWE